MPRLILCQHCSVHMRADERICPHCNTPLVRARSPLATAALLGLAASACNTMPMFEAEYGGPPLDHLEPPAQTDGKAPDQKADTQAGDTKQGDAKPEVPVAPEYGAPAIDESELPPMEPKYGVPASDVIPPPTPEPTPEPPDSKPKVP